jgi:tRNA G26 N,N-dimethylase Trm1
MTNIQITPKCTHNNCANTVQEIADECRACYENKQHINPIHIIQAQTEMKARKIRHAHEARQNHKRAQRNVVIIEAIIGTLTLTPGLIVLLAYAVATT